MRGILILSGLTLAASASADVGETTLNFTGSCPGPITVTIAGATPGGAVAIVSGSSDGTTPIPGGSCAGTDLGLAGGVKLRKTVTADATGAASLSIDAPGGVCGAKAQAVDLSTCQTSGVRTLAGPLTPVGSYALGNGPVWADNPVPMDCREACAVEFGGSASSYICSTDAAGANAGKAWVDGWGELAYCSYGGAGGASDDYSKNETYDCGYTACSFSAYVYDHCAGDVNYCWQ